MKSFLHTGNCTPPTEEITSHNPTLFSLREKSNKVIISSCPFDAYLPIPIEEQVASDFQTINQDAYTYCKSKLKQLATEFRARRNRISFQFYFGECLDLCLRNEEMKKKFQVIHYPHGIVRSVGYANIISSSQNCLATLDSVLLTNSYLPYVNQILNLSIIEYIESSLCCPLSLIPTLYGVKLTNHLQLGSPHTVKLHGDFEKNLFTTLKWQQSPGYTENVPLEMSPVLQEAIMHLAAARFDYESQSCCGIQLYTFFFILQSLTSRCALLQPISTLQSLFLTVVQPDLLLAWQTEEAWMKGESLLQYSFANSDRETVRKSISSTATYYDLMLVELKIASSSDEIVEYSECNWITLFQQRSGKTTITAHRFQLTVDDLQDLSLSFLLVKDHKPSLALCIVDQEDNKILFMAKLNNLTSKLISISNPFSLQSTLLETRCEHKLYVTRCAEIETGFELDVSTTGVRISKTEGDLLLLVFI
jgi:hypothetical protein